MDIATYGAVVATAALLMSAGSLWLYWRRDRQSDADRQPEVRFEPSWFEGPSGWIALRVVVRNLDRFTMTVDEVRLLSPKSLKLASTHDAMENVDDYGDPKIVQPRASGRAVQFGTRLDSAGTASRPSAGSYTIGDTHGVDFLVSAPRSRSTLKLLISMSSSATAFKIRSRRIGIKLTPATDPTSTSAVAEN